MYPDDDAGMVVQSSDTDMSLPEKVRDSVELTKEVIEEEQKGLCRQEKEKADELGQQHSTGLLDTKSLASALSGVSPAELALVEKSQDSLQVTKKRMERNELTKSSRSIDSDASCDTSEGHSPISRSAPSSKKPKTRFFIAGQTSVPAKPERKSVGRRISEAFGLKSSKKQETKQSSPSGVTEHVKFDKFPEVID